jgi:exodeoxyribonuclease (lambda-induced)
MICIECQQGTDEWLAARAGVITASTFADATSKLKRASGDKKPGDPTDTSEKLAIATAIERISGQPYGDTFQTFAMRRGQEQEAFARMRYEARHGVIVEESGLILTDDRLFGCSVDGLIDDHGGFECKTPLDPLKVVNIIKTGDISEYMHQIQGCMWITGRKWWDFVMAVPDLEALNNGNELYVQRVLRDDDFIEQMEQDLWQFAVRVKRYEELLRKPYNTKGVTT